MENIFEKYQKIIANAKQDKVAMEKKALENPEQFLKEMGIDLNNIDKEQLLKIAKELPEMAKSFESIISGKNFKDVNNYHNSVKNKQELSEEEKKKLQELGIRAFYTDLKNKQQFCFIGNDCDKIIDAHSIQENGELSVIADNNKVFHFVQNIQTGSKEKQEVVITKASTFKGFCHKHDQIFEPIDKNKNISDEEKYFLYSLRSFAHSYFNIKSFKNYFLGLVSDSSSNLNPLIESIKGIANSIGYKLPSEFTEIELPKISKEQLDVLELERFEEHRTLLIKYVTEKDYSQLDYMVYETDHLCPIVCASWMVLHINIGNGFLILHNDNKPYYGFPIIISVLPDNNKTKIVLARFKNDNCSDLIFNQFKNLLKEPINFETEISKYIIENVENFYLAPKFWDNLNEQEKDIIFNAVTVDKKRFPEGRTEFEIVNFFDKKYKHN
jgi:hypothetical protein